MKIAVPVANKQLCMHFGHCEFFQFFDVDEKSNSVLSINEVTPPPHEPGVLPSWIAEQGVNIVIAGGMGMRAQTLFGDKGIKVVTGVEELDPRTAVENYLNGNLKFGKNACDH